MTISDKKAAVRKSAFAARKVAHSMGLDKDANHNLLAALALYPDAEVVSGFMPIRTEVSPIATMTILHGQGKRICVPVIVGAGQPLTFREWTPTVDMIDGPFGALVPAHGDDLDPDVLISPLLAFDAKGYRLGYGGGFYDRSLEGLRAMGKGVAIGFAYEAQKVKSVPIEPTDQKLDAMVTEAQVLRFKR